MNELQTVAYNEIARKLVLADEKIERYEKQFEADLIREEHYKTLKNKLGEEILKLRNRIKELKAKLGEEY